MENAQPTEPAPSPDAAPKPRRTAKRRWPWFLAGFLAAYLVPCLVGLVLRPFLPLENGDSFETQGLKACLYDYEKQEGPEGRAKYFEKATRTLDPVSSGRTLSKDKLLQYVGPPDLVTTDGAKTCFAYFYDRAGKRDTAAYVKIEDGVVKQIGYNVSPDPKDLTGWEPFGETETPSPDGE